MSLKGCLNVTYRDLVEVVVKEDIKIRLAASVNALGELLLLMLNGLESTTDINTKTTKKIAAIKAGDDTINLYVHIQP